MMSCMVPVAAAPVKAPVSLKAAPAAARLPAVSNRTIKKTSCMQVWQPTNNKYFETLSFLPPLSDEAIAKQVDYITRNGWTPCLEFSEAENAYVKDVFTTRLCGVASNYADNRYWTFYKLPMFGCSDSSQVLTEIANCVKSFPDAYIRLVAFDQVRQVQCAGFLVHRPESATDFCSPAERSV
ncbi:hypothetical protein WJX81_007946 [Elliptochloris bilobata]|uniref:Ribulose bisphosphate carboxylase small subunit, chloroplastic n=1 Tax=Elliptochloris bilobata TaxID=381761 RepID=A0AAW1SHQ2_9CHLO